MSHQYVSFEFARYINDDAEGKQLVTCDPDCGQIFEVAANMSHGRASPGKDKMCEEGEFLNFKCIFDQYAYTVRNKNHQGKFWWTNDVMTNVGGLRGRPPVCVLACLNIKVI